MKEYINILSPVRVFQKTVAYRGVVKAPPPRRAYNILTSFFNFMFQLITFTNIGPFRLKSRCNL